jgi:broad specificity phosphatase PhoE
MLHVHWHRSSPKPGFQGTSSWWPSTTRLPTTRLPTTRLTASLSDNSEEEPLELPTWNWSGSDVFTPLDDRHDRPPLALPALPGQRRQVVLVRHGQSTWNARSRIQGSSNFSVLTEEGLKQAESSAKVLEDWCFETMYVSPLTRALQTANIVWGGRSGSVHTLPALREIDLYSFQGLDKSAGRSLYPTIYEAWQRNPTEFEIDGHKPVNELWYRASLAWREILGHDAHGPKFARILVVAHNAVNQALLATALGLGSTFFRRLTQSNAAFSVLEFDLDPKGDSSLPNVKVERLNYSPQGPFLAHGHSNWSAQKGGGSSLDRLVLVSGDANSAPVTSSLRMITEDWRIDDIIPLVAVGTPAEQAADVITALQASLSTPRTASGRIVLAVAAPNACQLVLEKCLGASLEVAGLGASFTMSEGGVTVINYLRTAQSVNQGNLLCTNYTNTLQQHVDALDASLPSKQVGSKSGKPQSTQSTVRERRKRQ